MLCFLSFVLLLLSYVVSVYVVTPIAHCVTFPLSKQLSLKEIKSNRKNTLSHSLFSLQRFLYLKGKVTKRMGETKIGKEKEGSSDHWFTLPNGPTVRHGQLQPGARSSIRLSRMGGNCPSA